MFDKHVFSESVTRILMRTPVSSRVKLSRKPGKRISEGGRSRRTSPTKLCEKTDNLRIRHDSSSRRTSSNNSPQCKASRYNPTIYLLRYFCSSQQCNAMATIINTITICSGAKQRQLFSCPNAVCWLSGPRYNWFH